MKVIPELIRRYRFDKRLSQGQFGKLLGRSHASISDMELGKTKYLPIQLVEMLFLEDWDYRVKTPFGLTEKEHTEAVTEAHKQGSEKQAEVLKEVGYMKNKIEEITKEFNEKFVEEGSFKVQGNVIELRAFLHETYHKGYRKGLQDFQEQVEEEIR